MRLLSSPQLQLFLAITLIGTILICLQSSQPLLLSLDGESYLATAKTFGSNQFLTTEETLLKPPLYPMLIAITNRIIPNVVEAIRVLHLIVGLFAATLWCSVSRRFMPLYLSTLSFIAATLAAQILYRSVLTEWLSFCLLWVFLSCSLLMQSTWKKYVPYFCSFTASLLCLNHASYLPCLPIFLGFLLWMSRYKISLTALFFAVVIGLSPIVLWSMLRTGALYPYPYGSFVSIGPASLIGSAEIKSNDSDQLKQFISYINERKIPSQGFEDFYFNNIDTLYLSSIYDYNQWRVFIAYKKFHNLSWKEANTLAREYTLRVMLTHKVAYIRYIIEGLRLYADTLLTLIFLCLISILVSYFKNQEYKPLLVIVYFFTFLHTFRSLFIATTLALMPRYYLQTGALIYGFGVICIGLLFEKLRART
jgi:hypothetical protein